MPPLPLINNQEEIKKAGNVFRALAHPLRKRMLQLLEEKEQANVTQIYAELKLEQSVASQHLKILRDANLVETQRQGKLIVYKVNYNHLSKVEKIVGELLSV